MAPLPPPSLHPLHRRSADGGRIAGLFIGTLVGAVVTLALLYACFNCVFSPKTPTKAITGKGPCFLFPPNACALARAVPPAGEHAQGARKERQRAVFVPIVPVPVGEEVLAPPEVAMEPGLEECFDPAGWYDPDMMGGVLAPGMEIAGVSIAAQNSPANSSVPQSQVKVQSPGLGPYVNVSSLGKRQQSVVSVAFGTLGMQSSWSSGRRRSGPYWYSRSLVVDLMISSSSRP
ncbi:hypothetical protein BN1723_009882 [Verticillium longisporum]|uniref:Uncharacterized protein n=1 Tax=Verticillium longisporum TaxID=100787 RepID=A0A0G4KTB8_VERLO|nr:hypothetical protein BN1723_009882 [Verticillium longisporum]CRK16270.1 hypothetical protein BN1708_011707 [Verticillium longisporum]